MPFVKLLELCWSKNFLQGLVKNEWIMTNMKKDSWYSYRNLIPSGIESCLRKRFEHTITNATCWVCLAIFQLQVTFSKNGIKITTQTYARNFEVL